MKHARTLLSSSLGLGLLAASGIASAHEGHGLAGAVHWHTTDALGYLLLAFIATAACWFGGRK